MKVQCCYVCEHVRWLLRARVQVQVCCALFLSRFFGYTPRHAAPRRAAPSGRIPLLSILRQDNCNGGSLSSSCGAATPFRGETGRPAERPFVRQRSEVPFCQDRERVVLKCPFSSSARAVFSLCLSSAKLHQVFFYGHASLKHFQPGWRRPAMNILRETRNSYCIPCLVQPIRDYSPHQCG